MIYEGNHIFVLEHRNHTVIVGLAADHICFGSGLPVSIVFHEKYKSLLEPEGKANLKVFFFFFFSLLYDIEKKFLIFFL